MGEREQMYGNHNEFHPSIIKPDTYSSQKEVRAIWQPKGSYDIKPEVISLPLKIVKRHCEIID